MRYRLPLQGNPSTNVMLRNSYMAAFGAACYMSEVSTFDCFYRTWQTACAETPKIGAAAGQQPWDTGYACQPIGNGDYSLQIGSDVALKVVINYQHAPRQTPLVDINGTPTAVNGPYRDLTEPQGVEPGQKFECETVGVNADGDPLTQRKWILQVNRKKHAGKIHSDLAGFTWPCGPNGGPPMCMEPLELENPVDPVGTQPQVHHVVPMTDKRGCAWGTNSNKNAAVVSQKLNNYLRNHDPPAAEVAQLNSAVAYTP